MSHPAAARLTALLKHADLIGSVGGLLGWDEQVNLPPASSDRRADQMALMAGLRHSAATAPAIGVALQELENAAASLDADELVLLRWAKRDFHRATCLPAEYVGEKAALDSGSYHAWKAARAASDFAAFAPWLEKQVAMVRREAAYIGFTERPYDYLLDKYDPGLTEATVAKLFEALRAGLVPLVRKIAASPVRVPQDALRGFPVEGQRAFLREVTERLGFDYSRGRIDVAVHPFCSGDAADTRMTTRFNVDDPLDSLFSSIHETGHGLYTQGLPIEHLGTPRGQDIGMAIHESQSRLWENQVSRSRAFWTFFEPRFRATFPCRLEHLSSEQLHLVINEVKPTLIRVDSDEVTYNLHIVLRFEIERRLIAGELAVHDLPAAWSAMSEELIGLRPETDARGVLQDIHWSDGSFGYFPSYAIGNMIAAQLWYRVRDALPGLEADFERGEFTRMLGWLRDNIHRHGRRFDTGTLVRKVTGEEISPSHLLRYLEERYAPLYLAANR